MKRECRIELAAADKLAGGAALGAIAARQDRA
jgi:hypothetical protein